MPRMKSWGLSVRPSRAPSVTDPDSLYYLNERNPVERAFGESVRNALAKPDTRLFGLE